MRMCYATLHLKFNGTFLGRKILLNKNKEKNEKKETEKNESLTTKTETTIMGIKIPHNRLKDVALAKKFKGTFDTRKFQGEWAAKNVFMVKFSTIWKFLLALQINIQIIFSQVRLEENGCTNMISAQISHVIY